jgi:predicted Holliday junction resolvase-like endonuclease
MSNIDFILIIIFVVVIAYIFYKLGMYKKEIEWKSKLQKLRGEIADKQRAGIKGKVAETFAPYLGNFPFKPSECKFLGDPIDYVVFEGLDNRDIVGIHFLDVKSDSSELKKHQRQVKDIIAKKGNISFKTFRFRTKL